jgi:ABC-type dipeptide/oligopeptide/nickel transport system permease subunit
LIAPHNPFDAASLNLLDAFKPPVWVPDGNILFLLGTDDQGRDILSMLMYGSRNSLVVGFCAVIFAVVIGISPASILLRHILPNVFGPVLVIGTIGLALAIITEATLSFLGVGMPPTTPSLGTLIRVGNNFLFSGEWWITLFPSVALVILVLAVNLLGDWLRDALNPKLR